MFSEPEQDIIERSKQFVKDSFVAHPHFSFNDWSVMYNHSCTVASFAGMIGANVVCDKLLVILGALLHDIGKTYEADEETLHFEHESFNLIVAEPFLETLGLSPERLERLKRLVSYQDKEGVEMKVIKDADAIALPADKRLSMLYIEWAVKEGLRNSIERKIRKFDKLHFELSKEIGKPLFSRMKQDWDEYRRTINAKSL
ncbi:MAG: HD domain-containing protein [Candidatus Moraniibacteriota bacterium]|nr:MAG: HD domain-containing protein [Candidatus Moranbacteria bacterium]